MKPLINASTLCVLQPGMLTTVQDQGRFGFQKLGVCQAGSADLRLASIANALVGNADGCALLEFSMLGPTLEVLGGNLVCAVAADCKLEVNGEPVACWQSFELSDGDELKVGVLQSHRYGYIAVAGGTTTPLVYGSRSTHLRSGMGGFNGRALQMGDELPLADQVENSSLSGVGLSPTSIHLLLQAEPSFPVVLGPQADAFAPSEISKFLNTKYSISKEADRMGIRMQGETLVHKVGADILSDGIAPGSIQIPGSGLPIVLMADRQTIGGYTKIATLVSAYIGILAQLAPGTEVSFYQVNAEEAIGLSRALARDLQSLKESIVPLVKTPDTFSLMRNNLISGVVNEHKEHDEAKRS